MKWENGKAMVRLAESLLSYHASSAMSISYYTIRTQTFRQEV